jgi:hypothetical protein
MFSEQPIVLEIQNTNEDQPEKSKYLYDSI